MLALAAALHGLLLFALMRGMVPLPVEPVRAVVEVAIHAAMRPPVPAPTVTRPSSTTRPAPRPLQESPASARPAAEAVEPAEAAIAALPAPPASAASAPLDLTLSRERLRALETEAGSRLSALGPHAAARSPYESLAPAADGVTTLELPHGVTEVHSHGGCFRLVPTARSQSDPFNHGGERLTGPCVPGM